ncbi:MAG TPA: hypothetical protein VGR55_00610 [Candidatus Acidoferrum sp.]|nr:hypothetical protein [Candidatus Acidoferrum sp.]
MTLTSVSPSSVTAGGPPFILTVNGSNLTAGYATLVWNGGQQIASVGAGHSTESTQATFLIDPSLIANPGNVSIAVIDGINNNQLSNTLTLTVMPHTTTACGLFGLYHYLVTGFEQKGAMVAAGAFGVDASGNVTGEYGFGDLSLPFSLFGNTPDFIGPGFPGPAGGQCTNSSTPNQGTLTLSCACGTASSTFTFTYTFILQQGGGGRLVESNDAVSQFGNMSGSGVFAKVIPDSVFIGDYAFGMTGTDTHGDQGKWTHFGTVGAFTFSSGNLNGVADVNDGGTVLSNATLGPAAGVPLFSPDAYSIDQVNLDVTGLGNNFVFHMLMTSPATGFVVGDVNSSFAPSGTFEDVILAGFVSSQANAGAYGNNSLNAPLVLSTSGVPPPVCCTISTDTTLGLASGFNSGAGTFNLELDNVSGGVANLNQAVTGVTYSVASNGRATVSYSVGGNTLNYVYYLDSVNDGYILGLGNSAEFGFFQPQAAGPFTTASINGTFGSATFFPLTPMAPNLATEITLNNGSMSANTPAGALTGTYAVAPSGRGTASVNLPVLGGKDLVFYVIGPDSVVVMGSDATASDAISFMHL